MTPDAAALAIAAMLTADGARRVEEWVGTSPDQAVPDRVKDRVLRRFEKCCYNCGNEIRSGKPWTCDHIVALINGGQNRERNLGPLCSICTKPKDAADVGQKSKVYQKRAKDMGLFKRKGSPMPGSRDSPWKRPMNGRTVRR